MHENTLAVAARLSDEALVARVLVLTKQSRHVTVELLVHLAELDRRKLYRGQGTGKLFPYCTEVLRLSEAAACNRIKAARAARKFPVVLDLLADGRVNLTTIRLLAPHLTAENHASVLGEAQGMTRRQVDKLVARLAPRPDVKPSIRRLPAPRDGDAARPPDVMQRDEAISSVRSSASTTTPAATLGASSNMPRPVPGAHRPIVAPLSPNRYRLQITIEEDTHDDLRCLQDLMRREIPDGDPAAIVARALKLLRREAEKKAFAATSNPRSGRTPNPGSRHIPASVSRAVWLRDEGQCAFVATNGRRCAERSYIEYHHANEPYALGGEATVENISLRCRAHNVYESELIFGPFDSSRVRQTPAVYKRTVGPVTGPGTSRAAYEVDTSAPANRLSARRASD
jgi:hypothetical protein